MYKKLLAAFTQTLKFLVCGFIFIIGLSFANNAFAQTPPIDYFNANPPLVPYGGGTTTLIWSSPQATGGCDASEGWSGNNKPNTGSQDVYLTETTAYILTCYDGETPPNSNSASVTVPIDLLHPTVTISASPDTVPYNEPSTITWSSTSATTCTASGGSNGWAGTRNPSGTFIRNITSAATYTIYCSNSSYTSPLMSVDVNILPSSFRIIWNDTGPIHTQSYPDLNANQFYPAIDHTITLTPTENYNNVTMDWLYMGNQVGNMIVRITMLVDGVQYPDTIYEEWNATPVSGNWYSNSGNPLLLPIPLRTWQAGSTYRIIVDYSGLGQSLGASINLDGFTVYGEPVIIIPPPPPSGLVVSPTPVTLNAGDIFFITVKYNDVPVQIPQANISYPADVFEFIVDSTLPVGKHKFQVKPEPISSPLRTGRIGFTYYL